MGACAVEDGGALPGQVAAIQRSRLLAAALREFDERGYAATSVAHITGRSRVSRRTFYELFANREECLVALLQDAVATVEHDLAAADLGGRSWREQMRGGLWAVLCFLDREPALARVCVVQALGAGSGVLERREAILARLAAAVDEGRTQSARGAGCTRLTAEGVVGAALTIVYGRLLRRDSEPLRNLMGELAGMIVLPYLGGATARREQDRAVPAPVPESLPPAARDARQAQTAMDPLAGISMRLTYRTVRVLEGASEHPGASNRQLANYAGIGDPGQVSKLLARLKRLGLIENQTDTALQKGEANAWTLTSKGRQIAHNINTHTTHEKAA